MCRYGTSDGKTYFHREVKFAEGITHNRKKTSGQSEKKDLIITWKRRADLFCSDRVSSLGKMKERPHDELNIMDFIARVQNVPIVCVGKKIQIADKII